MADAGRDDHALSGGRIIREIVASGIEFVVSVPDITTSEGLLRPLAQGTAPRWTAQWIAAPGVTSVIVTVCALEKEPPLGEMTGVAAVGMGMFSVKVAVATALRPALGACATTLSVPLVAMVIGPA